MCSAHANESTENIDEIVQDHDTFGTDENEEDSMDSLTMALMESRSVATSTVSNSSYMSSLSANKIGGKIRCSAHFWKYQNMQYTIEKPYRMVNKTF